MPRRHCGGRTRRGQGVGESFSSGTFVCAKFQPFSHSALLVVPITDFCGVFALVSSDSSDRPAGTLFESHV